MVPLVDEWEGGFVNFFGVLWAVSIGFSLIIRLMLDDVYLTDLGGSGVSVISIVCVFSIFAVFVSFLSSLWPKIFVPPAL